jgi:hypothetical protein
VIVPFVTVQSVSAGLPEQAIVPQPSCDYVVSITTDQCVVSFITDKPIFAGIPTNKIVAKSSVKLIIVLRPEQTISSVLTKNSIGPRPTNEGVFFAAADEQIITMAAENSIRTLTTVKHIVGETALYHIISQLPRNRGRNQQIVCDAIIPVACKDVDSVHINGSKRLLQRWIAIDSHLKGLKVSATYQLNDIGGVITNYGNDRVLKRDTRQKIARLKQLIPNV